MKSIFFGEVREELIFPYPSLKQENKENVEMILDSFNKLAADQFKVGAKAADANDFVIYNKATGALLYDADGNGANAAVQITTVGTGLNMTNADIVVI